MSRKKKGKLEAPKTSVESPVPSPIESVWDLAVVGDHPSALLTAALAAFEGKRVALFSGSSRTEGSTAWLRESPSGQWVDGETASIGGVRQDGGNPGLPGLTGKVLKLLDPEGWRDRWVETWTTHGSEEKKLKSENDVLAPLHHAQVITPGGRLRWGVYRESWVREFARELVVGVGSVQALVDSVTEAEASWMESWTDHFSQAYARYQSGWGRLLPRLDPRKGPVLKADRRSKRLAKRATSVELRLLSQLFWFGAGDQLAESTQGETQARQDWVKHLGPGFGACSFLGGRTAWRSYLRSLAVRWGAQDLTFQGEVQWKGRTAMMTPRSLLRAKELTERMKGDPATRKPKRPVAEWVHGIQVIQGEGADLPSSPHWARTVVMGTSENALGSWMESGQKMGNDKLSKPTSHPFSHWRYTVGVTLRDEAVPPGITTRMLWSEPGAPWLEFELQPAKAYGGTEGNWLLFLRTPVPAVPESLEPKNLQRLTGRMLRQAQDVLPFMEFHLVRVAPDFRQGVEASVEELAAVYPWKSLEEIPESLKLHRGQGLGIETGVKGLYRANAMSWPEGGSSGELLTALSILVPEIARDNPLPSESKKTFKESLGRFLGRV